MNDGIRRRRTLVGSVAPCAWSPSGHLLICGLKNGGIGAWHAVTGKRVWETNLPLEEDALDKNDDPDFQEPSLSIATSEEVTAVIRSNVLYIFSTRYGELLNHLFLPENYNYEDRWTLANIEWTNDGQSLAISGNGRVYVYDMSSGLLTELPSHPGDDGDLVVVRVGWSSDDNVIVAASHHAETWSRNGDYQGRFEFGSGLYDVCFSPGPVPRYLAAGASDRSVIIWNVNDRTTASILEGHTGDVKRVAFTGDGRFLLTTSDHELRLWLVEGWKPVSGAKIGNPDCLAASPNGAEFAVSGASKSIQIWQLDADRLVRNAAESESVTYTSAKIVLVGDSGVGKTGLGWRLAHGNFKEHSSTHGQQFWLLHEASAQRADGTYCEAVLWDLAGQPDYRLVHALFLDDADLALLVFDPTHAQGPVQGTGFWIKQLNLGATADNASLTAALVAARCDRGSPSVTMDELINYATANGLQRVFLTSASDGTGVADLSAWISEAIDWDRKPTTVTTALFKDIKDYVLKLKEGAKRQRTIYPVSEIGKLFRNFSGRRGSSLEEVDTALLHLSNHGYVALLRGSNGERRVLLVPELLNNLAASVVLEARRNPRGLGSIDETRLLAGDYDFEELKTLDDKDKDAMLDSVVAMLLQHNVCFREVDPLNKASYIVFPELINSRKPINADVNPAVEDSSYTISGSVENVYASLVVLMGYTSMFTRTAQWRANARYEVGDGLVCGFRLAEDRGGEQDFVLYYGNDVGPKVKMLFKGLFESFLSRHDVTINRYDPVECDKGHRVNRVLLRELSSQGLTIAHCPFCAGRIDIPDSLTPTTLSEPEAQSAKKETRIADQRHKFEEALFKLKALAPVSTVERTSVFISYAWGNPEEERWVERRLASDLLKAGVDVVLDKWENATIGGSIPRFVERANAVSKIIVVGTPAYKDKYSNDSEEGYVVAAEGDIIGFRMIGAESRKRTILPILLSGSDKISFPGILLGRVYGNFSAKSSYEISFIDLVASVYEISPKHEMLIDLKDSFSSRFS